MVIAFSSPVHGQTGSSMNLLALGIYTALKYKKRVLIMDSHFQSDGLETMLIHTNGFQKKEMPDEFGVDALIRGRFLTGIQMDLIYNCSYSFLDGLLSFLPGTRQTHRDIYLQSIKDNYTRIIAEASSGYDLVLIDLDMHLGDITSQILSMTDRQVINLSQNPNVLRLQFSQAISYPGEKFYILGNYDKDSRFNLTNLHYLFPGLSRKNTVPIPYHTQWRDAVYEGMAISFMTKNLHAQDKSKTAVFMKSIDRVAGSLIRKGGE